MAFPRVKICGITRLEDARYCAGAGAAYLGFVQDPARPEYVEPAVVREMLEWIHGPEPVGVFTDDDVDRINRVCVETGFALAQVDGPISREAVAAIEVPTIKTLVVQHDASIEQLQALADDYRDHADFIRLDTRRTSLWGGEGESFNWRVARALAAEFQLFLAGDFDAAGIRDAAESMRPFALDVASSVESAPGIKDFERLDALWDAIRSPNEP